MTNVGVSQDTGVIPDISRCTRSHSVPLYFSPRILGLSQTYPAVLGLSPAVLQSQDTGVIPDISRCTRSHSVPLYFSPRILTYPAVLGLTQSHCPSHPTVSHCPSHPTLSHCPSHPTLSHCPSHPTVSHCNTHSIVIAPILLGGGGGGGGQGPPIGILGAQLPPSAAAPVRLNTFCTDVEYCVYLQQV